MADRQDPTIPAGGASLNWFSRSSWGAIFSGVFIGIGIQIMLSLLGASIGLASINPWNEQNPAGLTIGAVIWFIISGIISFFIAGWVTGRLSGEPAKLDRMLNALVLWGIVIVLSIILMVMTTTTIIGGVFGIAKSTLGMVSSVAPAVGQAAQQNLGNIGPVQEMQTKFNQIMDQAKNATPQERQQIQSELQTIGSAIQQFVSTGQISDEQRQNISRILSTRGNMSKQQADSSLNQWISQAQTARQNVQAQGDTLKRVAESTTQAAAVASFWMFFMLLLDAIAAMFGASMVKIIEKKR